MVEAKSKVEEIRSTFNINNPIIMYVGNLEFYQGIDLLLEGFTAFVKQGQIKASLVIIGGNQQSIIQYSEKASQLGMRDSVYFIGARPFETLSSYLSQADILVSPRLKGVNTPMKLFSYLKSGKPTLVTNLITHTQVVDSNTAYLVEPTPEGIAQGLNTLLTNQELREKLGDAGKELIETCYSHDAFVQKFDQALSWLESELRKHHKQARGLAI